MHTSQPGNDQSCIFYNQPKPNIQPWKHLALCTIVSADCWKSSDFWLLYKLIKLITSMLIYKDFNYHPIVQSIILVSKVTDQTLKIFRDVHVVLVSLFCPVNLSYIWVGQKNCPVSETGKFMFCPFSWFFLSSLDI